MIHETGARPRKYSFEFLFLGAFTSGRYSIWSSDYGVSKPITEIKEYHNDKCHVNIETINDNILYIVVTRERV